MYLLSPSDYDASCGVGLSKFCQLVPGCDGSQFGRAKKRCKTMVAHEVLSGTTASIKGIYQVPQGRSGTRYGGHHVIVGLTGRNSTDNQPNPLQTLAFAWDQPLEQKPPTTNPALSKL